MRYLSLAEAFLLAELAAAAELEGTGRSAGLDLGVELAQDPVDGLVEAERG